SPAHLGLTENKKREQTKPDRARGNRPRGEHDRASKADHARNFQTANRADPQPKQTANNLSAIERVDRQWIEKQQEAIDEGEAENKVEEIGISYSPLPANRRESENGKEWKQGGVHQRTSCETPEIRAWPGWRFNESD